MMRKIYIFMLFLLGIATHALAQITVGRPTGENTGIAPWAVTYTPGSNWSNITTNIGNMADGDLSTSGIIGVQKTSSWELNSASVQVDFTVPSNNNGTIFIETDEGRKLVTSRSSNLDDNNGLISLWNGSTQYTSNQVSIEERTKPDGTTYYAIHAPSYGTVTKMSINVLGYSTLSETDAIIIKDIYWYTGTASNTDCGEPLSTRVTNTIAGIPLGFLATNNPGHAIDGNASSWASDAMTFGLGGVGFFYYTHNIYFNGLSNTNNSSVRVVLGNGVNIGVNLSGTVYKISFVNHGTVVDETDWRTFSVLGLLGILDYSRVTATATSSQPFDEVIVRIGYAGVNVTLIAGEYFRLYEVKRTANSPTVEGSSVYATYGTTATVTATGIGNEFVWRRSTTETYDVYDDNGTKTGTVTDTVAVPGAAGIISTTTATSTDPSGLSTGSFTTGALQKDSTIFVNTVLVNCTSDSSAASQINIVLTSTPPVLSASVNSGNTAVELSWSIANEYKVENMILQRRVAGSSDTWENIDTIESSAPVDPDVSSRHTNSTTSPTTYVSTDSDVDLDKVYEYRVIIHDNSINSVASNIAVQPYALPVTYAKPLAANAIGATNVLTWTSATEINNKGFHILRSADSKVWNEIGFKTSSFVDGSGNGASYSYIDNNPLTGINYYQLKQEDLDGKTAISNIVQLTNTTVGKREIKLYPNPVISYFTISNASTGSNYRILDFSGRVVRSGTINSSPFNIDASALIPGVYIVELPDAQNKKYVGYKIIKK